MSRKARRNRSRRKEGEEAARVARSISARASTSLAPALPVPTEPIAPCGVDVASSGRCPDSSEASALLGSGDAREPLGLGDAREPLDSGEAREPPDSGEAGELFAGGLDAHFFDSTPLESWFAYELEFRDPHFVRKMTAEVARRRAHLARYVVGVVGAAAALGLAALVKLAVVPLDRGEPDPRARRSAIDAKAASESVAPAAPIETRAPLSRP